MKTTRLLTSILTATLLAGSAYAGDSLKETAVMATLKQKYPSTVIKSVSSTNLPGVYEVMMGKNVAYVEESGRYFLFGHMFDMQTQTDLTAPKKGRQAAADPARQGARRRTTPPPDRHRPGRPRRAR